MQIEIAPHERMSESGNSLMRLIQNNELPTLDLLVRESIQNSSDASLNNVDVVNISYNINEFKPQDLNKHFEGVEDNLNKRFGKQNAQLLEIRDTNTTGLVGPLHHSEVKGNDFGNLINLVYEISKPQQKEGAGGSWGLGKTIYFRVGIGLVIYYSKVRKDNGEYESRLVACLVEDEKQKDTLIPSQNDGPARGIAWWGTRLDERHTIPITNEKEINKILESLNVAQFGEKETGTSIIIPYINTEKLMYSAKAKHSNEEQRRCWWLNNIEDYLKVSVQRWYGPRIRNRGYKFEKMLNVSVNKDVITPSNMLSTFKVFQELYNFSKYANDVHIEKIVEEQKINKEKINLRNVFKLGGEAGEIIFTKLNKEELMMTPPNNQRSPFELTDSDNDNESSELNQPLIGYLRKPGMIVNYDSNGSWVNKIQPSSNGEYIIGLFVPNSWNELNDEFENIYLEEYLRRGEKADHTSWNDWTINDKNPQIVSKIKNNMAKKINAQYEEKEKKNYETLKTGIGKSLAEILLPPENFGKQPTSTTTPGKAKGRSKRGAKSKLELTNDPVIENGKVKLKYKLIIGSKASVTKIELKANSESGQIRADFWEQEKQIGTQFPIKLNGLEVKKMTINNANGSVNLQCDEDHVETSHPNLGLSLLKSERYQVPYGVKITKLKDENITVTGELEFMTEDNGIQGTVSAVDEEGE